MPVLIEIVDEKGKVENQRIFSMGPFIVENEHGVTGYVLISDKESSKLYVRRGRELELNLELNRVNQNHEMEVRKGSTVRKAVFTYVP